MVDIETARKVSAQARGKADAFLLFFAYRENGKTALYCIETKEIDADCITFEKGKKGKLYPRFRPCGTWKQIHKRGNRFRFTLEEIDGILTRENIVCKDGFISKNRGDRIEAVLRFIFTGEKKAHDIIRRDIQGDVKINGVDYQIKFEGATL